MTHSQSSGFWSRSLTHCFSNLFALHKWHPSLNDTGPPQNCMAPSVSCFFHDNLRDPPTTRHHNYIGHFFWEASLWKLILKGVFPALIIYYSNYTDIWDHSFCSQSENVVTVFYLKTCGGLICKKKSQYYSEQVVKVSFRVQSEPYSIRYISVLNRRFLYVPDSKVAHEQVSQWNTGFSQLYHRVHFEITPHYVREDTVCFAWILTVRLSSGILIMYN